MTAAKVVLGLYLGAQVLAGLYRVTRDVDREDEREMAAVGIAATALALVHGGLFVALVYA
jgi:hypothetical protein